MVVHESFVTRKPLEFTIIVLFIIFILLIPVFFLTKDDADQEEEETEFITQTYPEVNFIFSPESDLSESDKRYLFRLDYENRFVQWTGTLLACNDINGMFRVSVDHSGNGFGDVLFTTFKDCTNITKGSDITYRMKLIDWKVTTFIGKEGEIL